MTTQDKLVVSIVQRLAKENGLSDLQGTNLLFAARHLMEQSMQLQSFLTGEIKVSLRESLGTLRLALDIVSSIFEDLERLDQDVSKN
jgi:hypothetical protein